jgi:hypothetical protein
MRMVNHIDDEFIKEETSFGRIMIGEFPEGFGESGTMVFFGEERYGALLNEFNERIVHGF